MTQKLSSPPFISEPPIYDSFLDENGNMNNSWVNWINSITRIMGFSITHDYIIRTPVSGPTVREDAVLLEAISYSKADRDLLESANSATAPRVGTIIYNTTSGRMNFREASGWVTFTAVPAP